MSERWWDRKRRKKHPWFHFFRQFDRMEKIMEEMMRQAFRPFRRPYEGIGESKRLSPRIYGFSITPWPRRNSHDKAFRRCA